MCAVIRSQSKPDCSMCGVIRAQAPRLSFLRVATPTYALLCLMNPPAVLHLDNYAVVF